MRQRVGRGGRGGTCRGGCIRWLVGGGVTCVSLFPRLADDDDPPADAFVPVLPHTSLTSLVVNAQTQGILNQGLAAAGAFASGVSGTLILSSPPACSVRRFSSSSLLQWPPPRCRGSRACPSCPPTTPCGGPSSPSAATPTGAFMTRLSGRPAAIAPPLLACEQPSLSHIQPPPPALHFLQAHGSPAGHDRAADDPPH
jgi:hypothetical protein